MAKKPAATPEITDEQIAADAERVADQAPVIPEPEADPVAAEEQAAREAVEARTAEETAAAATAAQETADAAKAADDAAAAERLAEAQAAPSEDDVSVNDIITAQKGDNGEQTRLRGVFKRYFEENPERATWTEVKTDMINQIARAGDVTN